MKASHRVNWNSTIQREGEVHTTEIEKPLLAGKGFNINLVHFLPQHRVIISNMQVCSFTGTISHVHEISSTKNYDLWRPVYIHTVLLLRRQAQSSNMNHWCFIAIKLKDKKELYESQWSTLRGFNWQHLKFYIASKPLTYFVMQSFLLDSICY